MSRFDEDDVDASLDRMLAQSSPPTTTRTDELDRDLLALIARTGRERSRSRRPIQITTGAALLALLIGGGGVAVAGNRLWSDPLTQPTGDYLFDLPSGNVCSVRPGEVESVTPLVEAAVLDFYSGDVASKIDLEAAMAERRDHPDNVQLADGHIIDLVPGSPLYSADRDYRNAMEVAVTSALMTHLQNRGVVSDFTGGFMMSCTNDDEMAITAEDLGFTTDQSGVAP